MHEPPPDNPNMAGRWKLIQTWYYHRIPEPLPPAQGAAENEPMNGLAMKKAKPGTRRPEGGRETPASRPGIRTDDRPGGGARHSELGHFLRARRERLTPEALGLPGDGTAHVGLTAATGERWQAHDVTSWAVCDRPGRDAVP